MPIQHNTAGMTTKERNEQKGLAGGRGCGVVKMETKINQNLLKKYVYSVILLN
jgi:hypothetical protein